jgi:hypothetical protein
VNEQRDGHAHNVQVDIAHSLFVRCVDAVEGYLRWEDLTYSGDRE